MKKTQAKLFRRKLYSRQNQQEKQINQSCAKNYTAYGVEKSKVVRNKGIQQVHIKC